MAGTDRLNPPPDGPNRTRLDPFATGATLAGARPHTGVEKFAAVWHRRHMLLFVTLLLACTKTAPKEDLLDTALAAGDDLDSDGFTSSEGDCDDEDGAVNPSAEEACNGTDDDCDGSIDEEVASTWYADRDGDGFGDESTAVSSCEGVAGYVRQAGDCDDTRDDVSPAAQEDCDGQDDDCDGDSAEEGQRTWYADVDGDGFGDDTTAASDCADWSGAGWVLVPGDCDDRTAMAYPERPEDCDELDNDCDGTVDEDVGRTFWADLDGDGWGSEDLVQRACALPTGYATGAGDCNDADAAYHPGATEACDDPRDLNCDGSIAYADADGDGTPACRDCDDARADIRPGATEVCNTVDDDCDGFTDDLDPGLDRATTTAWHPDVDLDGHGDAALALASCAAPTGWRADASDCDDRSAAVHPGAAELCGGGDEDCDGLTEDDDADVLLASTSSWWRDTDGDGFGAPSAATDTCDAPAGYVATGDDCDDATAAVFPGAVEVCNDRDDDCDTLVDDDDPGRTGGTLWYPDVDGDGHGDGAAPEAACDLPAGFVASGDDCDDARADVFPGASESCDGRDNDCDGLTDDADPGRVGGSSFYVDADGDGYGTGATTVACSAAAGTATRAGDCNDSAAGTNPGAAEICADDTDQDCDGSTSEGCAGTTFDCGISGAMDPGNVYSCTLPVRAPIDTVTLSVAATTARRAATRSPSTTGRPLDSEEAAAAPSPSRGA